MKAPRYARGKTEAAKLAGMSRTLLYQLLRLPGAPAPRADGRWEVQAIREFALKSAKKIEAPIERDKLQVELLNLRVKRAAAELSEFQAELETTICDKNLRCYEYIFRVTKIELHRAIDKLAQHFINREISKVGHRFIDEAVGKSVRAVEEKTGVTPNIEQSVIVPFERKAANA